MQRKHALGIVLGLGSVCALSACLLFRWDAVSPAISKAAEGIWSSRAEALADPIDDETETAARPTTPAPANPVRCPDVLQCDENPLIDAIRQVLRSKLDLVAWKGKWRLAQRADEPQYGHPFGSFLSAFAGDERFEWQYEWPQLCPTMKAKRTSGYVVLTSFNENWSAHLYNHGLYSYGLYSHGPIVMAHIVMAHIVMAYIVMVLYIVMVHIVMAYTVMA